MKIKDFFKADGKTIDWEKIEKLPEFGLLSRTRQSVKWHKEGDVMAHTKLVCESMERLLADDDDEAHRQTLLAAALCHDLGKGKTTHFDQTDGDYHCKDHGAEGARITRTLLADEDTDIREKVCYIVRNHMALHHILEKEDDALDRKLIQMSFGLVPLCDMLLMKQADSEGSINDVETPEYILCTINAITERAERLGCLDTPYGFTSRTAKHIFAATGKISDVSDCDGKPFAVHVMVGLPGSGKNFYVDKFLGDIPMVSRDDIRVEIGLKGEKPQGNRAEEDLVTDIFNARVAKLCEERRDFVVNNVNLRKTYRDMLLKLIGRSNAVIEYVVIDTPLNLCKKRREGQVPESVIDRMYNHIDFPTPLEYDELVVV